MKSTSKEELKEPETADMEADAFDPGTVHGSVVARGASCVRPIALLGDGGVRCDTCGGVFRARLCMSVWIVGA